MPRPFSQYKLTRLAATAALTLVFAGAGTRAFAVAGTENGKALAPNTRFYTPPPAAGSEQQALALLKSGDLGGAVLIAKMELTPQAVWLTGGTPEQVQTMVAQTMKAAAARNTVPLFVIYNIPGRDCGSYSAGGAENTADYERVCRERKASSPTCPTSGGQTMRQSSIPGFQSASRLRTTRPTGAGGWATMTTVRASTTHPMVP